MNNPAPEQAQAALTFAGAHQPTITTAAAVILAAEVRRLRVVETDAIGLSTALQVANQRVEAAEARAREWANVAGLNGADKDAAPLAGRHWKERAEAAEARLGGAQSNSATPKSK